MAKQQQQRWLDMDMQYTEVHTPADIGNSKAQDTQKTAVLLHESIRKCSSMYIQYFRYGSYG